MNYILQRRIEQINRYLLLHLQGIEILSEAQFIEYAEILGRLYSWRYQLIFANSLNPLAQAFMNFSPNCSNVTKALLEVKKSLEESKLQWNWQKN